MSINVLPVQVANLIAAGEVVDRPASAVKEMMENSIDAGAGRLTVEIKNGGSTLMRVTDNGCGMSPEDCKKCILRHATSKIQTENDLDGITTLGFRGEALAAISAVSKFRVMTRQKDAVAGCNMVCENGQIVSFEEIGCPVGTTIIAEDLFMNVPARRKFLRRDAAETAAVSAVIEKIALSRPDIAITYITDGQVRFSTSGNGKLGDVIYAALGRDFVKMCRPVHDMTDGVEVIGYVGTPEFVKSSRSGENFFINGRFVRCSTASAALEQAFSTYIPKEKFPVCVLNINFNPAFVDVNVHPQKLEVKFSNEKPVFNAVYCAVRNYLRSTLPFAGQDGTRLTSDSFNLYGRFVGSSSPTPEEADRTAEEILRAKAKYQQIEMGNPIDTPPAEDGVENTPDGFGTDERKNAGAVIDMAEGKTVENSVESVEKPLKSSETTPKLAYTAEKYCRDAVQNIVENRSITVENRGITPANTVGNGIKAVEKAVQNSVDNCQTEEIQLPAYKISGVVFNCYIIVEIGSKVLCIDKHAAHERIIFERLRSNLDIENPPSQRLLLPLPVSLSEKERVIAAEYSEELSAAGFEWSADGLTAYPLGFDRDSASSLFQSLISSLEDGGDSEKDRRDFYERALFQASCKAAVKAGREDLGENIDWIVRQVLSNPKIRYCPHGRPVAVDISKADFEKRFERI